MGRILWLNFYSTLLNTTTMRSRDEVLPASPLHSSKRQGNEVEAGKYPDRKVVGSLFVFKHPVVLPQGVRDPHPQGQRPMVWKGLYYSFNPHPGRAGKTHQMEGIRPLPQLSYIS